MRKVPLLVSASTLSLLLVACGGGTATEPEADASSAATAENSTPPASSVAPSASSSPESLATATTTAPTTGEAAADATPSSDATTEQEPQCSGVPAQQAVENNIGQIEPYDGGTPSARYEWSTSWFNADNYDDCAGLSAIVITIESATASSPCHIMLFHNGEFVGTATSEAYGFEPSIQRVDDSTLQVTYVWPGPGDSNAYPTESSVATFTYDDATDSVSMSGELPSYA